MGSIAAGGRYDGLVGMFSGSPVPAVGVSIGIERIFTILEELETARQGKIRATQTQVFMASIGPNLLANRMQLCADAWAHGIKAEFLYDLKPSAKKQMDKVLDECIPLMVFVGETEVEQGIVKVRPNLLMVKSRFSWKAFGFCFCWFLIG